MDDSGQLIKVIREITILKRLNNLPNAKNFVTELYEVKMTKDEDTGIDHIFIVMEYMDSDLRNFILKTEQLNKKETYLIIYNLLAALKFIHSANVIHRDIKPSNLLISKDFKIKICDFGIARTLPESCIG